MDSEVRSGCLHLRGDITVRSLNGKNYRRFQEQRRQPETSERPAPPPIYESFKRARRK